MPPTYELQAGQNLTKMKLRNSLSTTTAYYSQSNIEKGVGMDPSAPRIIPLQHLQCCNYQKLYKTKVSPSNFYLSTWGSTRAT